MLAYVPPSPGSEASPWCFVMAAAYMHNLATPGLFGLFRRDVAVAHAVDYL
jgi:hypothetical protein